MAKNIGDIWSADVAYAIGLLTSDGNLSKDGRHIEFCSKDKELVEVFCRSLRLSNRIGTKKRGTVPRKLYYRVQFGKDLLRKPGFFVGVEENHKEALWFRWRVSYKDWPGFLLELF